MPASAPIRSAAYDGHSAIRVQRVRLRRRLFTAPSVASTVVLVVGAWKLIDWLGEEVEDEEEAAHQARRARRPPLQQEDAPDGGHGREVAEDDEEEYDDDDQEEDDEEEGLIFFPTGFSRPRPRQFYRGSDPEWQTFVRLCKDRQRMDKIRGELVSLVRDLAVRNPRLSTLVGEIDIKKGAIWIETKFPDGPPLEYERPGFMLTEDLTFKKTTIPVQEIHHKRLADLLTPTSTMATVYLDMKRRMLASWQDFRRYTGLDKNSPPTAEGIIGGLPMSPVTPVQPMQSAATPNAPTLPAQADAEKQATPPPPSNPTLEKLGLSLPDPKQVPTLDLSYFRRVFRKNQAKLGIEPPRGTFIVTGLIEVIGDRAKMTLDVLSLYDPNLGRYVMLQARLRSLTQYQQRPKGGR